MRLRRLPALDDAERRRRRLAAAVRLGLITLLGAAGLWLVLAIDKANKAQLCLESGRRNCAIIQSW